MSQTPNAFGVVHKAKKSPIAVPPPYDGKRVLLGLSAIGAGSYLASKKIKQGKVSKIYEEWRPASPGETPRNGRPPKRLFRRPEKGQWVATRTDEFRPGSPNAVLWVRGGTTPRGRRVKDFTAATGGVAKRETVDQLAGNVVPANTLDAYRKSKKRKTEAATLHWGAQTAGNAAGVGAGMAIGGIAARKTGLSRAASKIGPVTISAAKKQKWAEYLAASTGGSAGGLAAGAYTHRKIRNSPRYEYRGKK